MARTWSNRPVCAVPAARFVESDSGESLSPVHAPERIIPATKAGFRPIVAPIDMNAMPSVAVTVQAEPRAMPTIEQRMHARGRNIPGAMILRP